MQSLINKQAAYAAALTAFKRHEAWGWHRVSPFTVEATAEGLTPMEEQENSVIQEGIDTYHRLKEELRVAKRRLKYARYKANRKARKAAEEDSKDEGFSAPAPTPSAPAAYTNEDLEELLEDLDDEPCWGEEMDARLQAVAQAQVMEPATTVVEEAAPPTKPYQERVRDMWQTQHNTFYRALSKFRRFNAKGGKATFQVLKDGANYEDMSLNMEELTVAGLRLWASILQAPHASKLRRAELEDLLRPVLATLAAGRPAHSSWVYL